MNEKHKKRGKCTRRIAIIILIITILCLLVPTASASFWEYFTSWQITETNISCVPTNPSPFNGQTNVPVTTNISWDCPNGGDVVYDIYFGAGVFPVLVESDYPDTTYDPGNLTSGVCYCWRIVSENGYGNGDTQTSKYWQFCTLAEYELFDKDYTSIWENYSGYNKSEEGCYEGSEINTGAFINMIPAFYTDKVGGIFWLFLFAIPFVVSFIKQESVIIPTILGFLVSSSMFFFLPIEFQTPARSLFYISLAGILYTFFKSRSY